MHIFYYFLINILLRFFRKNINFNSKKINIINYIKYFDITILRTAYNPFSIWTNCQAVNLLGMAFKLCDAFFLSQIPKIYFCII